MRSAEIARLAGVTVRTLRHYHQVGVLAEPPRTSNGYREYSVQDLVRLLRIRQLSSLGISLEQATPILDDTGSDAESSAELLEQLDGQLSQQIDQLTQQRQLIAHLRTHEATPDLPADLVPFYALFTLAGHPRRVAQMDRDQAILWSHFADETGKAYLTALYQKVREHPDLLTTSAELSRRFENLDVTSSDEQIADLVEDFTTSYAEVVSSLVSDGHVVELGRATELLNEYGVETYNEQQRKALDLLAQRFSDYEKT